MSVFQNMLKLFGGPISDSTTLGEQITVRITGLDVTFSRKQGKRPRTENALISGTGWDLGLWATISVGLVRFEREMCLCGSVEKLDR